MLFFMKKKNQEQKSAEAAPHAEPGNTGAKPASAPRPALPEKQRRELWIYIAVSIVAVELLITVGAVLYGFMSGSGTGRNAFVFPWLTWGALAVVSPTLILLLVHFADVGLFRAPGAEAEQEWQKHLPQRLQRFYRVIKGAPVVVVLLGIVLLGAALMTLDGALSALMGLASSLEPYIAHIVIGLAAILCVFILSAVWLSYRTRRLMSEYAFRREVLEKTGVIIVDKGSTPLPPGGTGSMPYAIAAAEDLERMGQRALPQAPQAEDESDIINAEAREIDMPSEDEEKPGTGDKTQS